MRKTRTRAWCAPPPGWDCALARLEDRFLLSGASAQASEVASGVATLNSVQVARASASVAAATSPSLLVPAPQLISVDSGVGNDMASAGVDDLPSAFGPGDLSLDPSSGGAPMGPIVIEPIVPVSGGATTGSRAGRSGAADFAPMVIYFYSFNASDDVGPAMATTADDLPAGDGMQDEAPDLADPAPVPQPGAAPGSPIRLDRAPEPAEADPSASVSPDAPAPPAPASVPDGPSPTPEPSEGESVPAEPPEPIGVGLRLTAPLVDAAGWDEAVGRLADGVDDLLSGLADLGREANYVPWIVAAGAALGASEVARRARSRPGLVASFVDGSVSVVGPEDDAGDRPRGAMAPLSDSVRRLLARGLSRWTTRR